MSLERNFPSVNDEINFQFSFSNEDGAQLIKGTGIVRWVRHLKMNNLRAGVGIEFLTLSPESVVNTVRVINQLKTGSYIPRN